MTLPTHVLGVELLKLIIRSKDPFPPKFYCHSCKQKFSIPITPTSPRPVNCKLCTSNFIEWILPEDPHQRAARLRDGGMADRSRSRSSPSPPSSPSPSPPASPHHPPPTSTTEKPQPEPDEELMDTEPTPQKEEEAPANQGVIGEPKTDSEQPTASAAAEPTAAEEKSGSGEGDSSEPPAEAMEQEASSTAAQKTDPPPKPEEEDEEEEEEEEDTRAQTRRSGGRLSSQPMVVISAGGDTTYPTLCMNLFPSLDEAGPRNEGRKGPMRTIMIQQKQSRHFTYLAQEYMAQIIEGRGGPGSRPRGSHQLLVGLTGGAQNSKSDPADFVWGARGLDSIISGLLDSMSDRGPPPAKKDKVDAIPVVLATEEIVTQNVDGCTVCKDAFKVDNKLRKLPCNHLFHETCIIPWLKLHDTCPTCRYHVNTDKDKPGEAPPEET